LTCLGAHASIAWLAVYGYRVLGFKLTLKDLYKSFIMLAIYAFISGYATYKYGGSDEIFLKHAPGLILFNLFFVGMSLVIFFFTESLKNIVSNQIENI
jgi:hypothetical protein